MLGAAREPKATSGGVFSGSRWLQGHHRLLVWLAQEVLPRRGARTAC